MKQLSISIDDDTFTKLKLKCIKERTQLTRVAKRLIEEWLENGESEEQKPIRSIYKLVFKDKTFYYGTSCNVERRINDITTYSKEVAEKIASGKLKEILISAEYFDFEIAFIVETNCMLDCYGHIKTNCLNKTPSSTARYKEDFARTLHWSSYKPKELKIKGY